MFYTIYKITNIINSKIYVGAHKSKKIYDSYMGSGTHLKLVQKKYGIENFRKEILYVYDNPEDMFLMESNIVDDDFVKREDTYNLCCGGGKDYENKSTYLNSRKHIKQLLSIREKGHKLAMKRVKWLRENDEKWAEQEKLHLRQLVEDNKKRYKKYGGTFTGKKHKESSKKKIGEANSINQKGTNNSQYGTMWITDGIVDKKMSNGDKIPSGFVKGRKGERKKHKCKYCGSLFQRINQEACCTKLCKIKHKGGMVIENYNSIYDSYIQFGSVNKAFKENDIGYNGRRCKMFHVIRELYGHEKYKNR